VHGSLCDIPRYHRQNIHAEADEQVQAGWQGVAETVADPAGSWVAFGVGHQYHPGPEAVEMSVAVQKTDWHCLPGALGHYAADDSARPHAVGG